MPAFILFLFLEKIPACLLLLLGGIVIFIFASFHISVITKFLQKHFHNEKNIRVT